MPWIGVGTRMNLLLQWSAIPDLFRRVGLPWGMRKHKSQLPTIRNYCLVAALPYRVRTFYR